MGARCSINSGTGPEKSSRSAASGPPEGMLAERWPPWRSLGISGGSEVLSTVVQYSIDNSIVPS